jgi:prepilin-type N-terminal cleavage/methylation domain-containing protein
MSSRREEGFTLIELLISIVLLGIIFGVLATAVVGFLTNAEPTIGRTDNAARTDLLAAFLNRDVSSAVKSTTGGTVCSGQTNLLVLEWRDWTASDATPSPSPQPGTTIGSVAYDEDVAAYYEVPDPTIYPGQPSRYMLERTYCTFNGTKYIQQETVELVPDLPSTGYLTILSGASGSCASPKLTVQAAPFQYWNGVSDATQTGYQFQGYLCARGQS